MVSRDEFEKNLHAIQERIRVACEQNQREASEVSLLPVTKNWPVSAVEYCRDFGIVRVGENRVQEARSKQEEICGIDWELIGHLQSNKINQVLGSFVRVQTVDSFKLIRKLQSAAERLGLICPVLLQVNAGEDPAKYGFNPRETEAALEEALGSANLQVDGLMTIAPYAPENPAVATACFAKLHGLRELLQQSHGVSLPELSMGMSDDLDSAIAQGSTMIRVGSALFGVRIQ
jgi:pyridoxal phosphate enzyme (YggS family)